jgi:hypothetical protein
MHGATFKKFTKWLVYKMINLHNKVKDSTNYT